jgi:hypothetical protein
VLASGAFLGVSVVSDSGSSAKPAPAQQPSGPSAHDTAACPVVHGPC